MIGIEEDSSSIQKLYYFYTINSCNNCDFDTFLFFLDHVFNVQQTADVCVPSRPVLPCVQPSNLSKHFNGNLFDNSMI